MARQFSELTESLTAFIERQQLFFVATAAKDGRINISPKGLDSLRVLGPNKVLWLNLTGSGNETAAHLLKESRMTLMFCSFDGKPLILRLYGTANTIHPRDEQYEKWNKLFPTFLGARQIHELTIEMVQTSCGYGVPIMKFEEERSKLVEWAENKGEAGIKQYWEEKNQSSIDGFDTGILEEK
ncbi:pyridoxamine 5'-phosphate oxidase family protein [Chitinophagales bacterium]|nr:pyridoxamine 5'-phosphate oxidase family protein [Chitinophagales bacterium]